MRDLEFEPGAWGAWNFDVEFGRFTKTEPPPELLESLWEWGELLERTRSVFLDTCHRWAGQHDPVWASRQDFEELRVELYHLRETARQALSRANAAVFRLEKWEPIGLYVRTLRQISYDVGLMLELILLRHQAEYVHR